MSTLEPSFGVDLITFFDPTYWGLADRDALQRLASEEPRSFWDRILEVLERTGIEQLEITFEPAGYRTALAAYGSATAFRAALDERGLALASGYFGDIEHAPDVTDARVRERIVAEAAGYAEFLHDVGGRYLVAGLPMRRNAAGGGYEPVDLRMAQPIAELVNEVAATTARFGVRTLLHPESHSTMWNSRDIDLMMLLTDSMVVGLCLDTGHVTLAGSDPVAIARRHIERLALLHWKDAAGAFPGSPPVDAEIFARHRPYFRQMGEGIVDWPALTAVVGQAGLHETVMLELDAAADPEAALRTARSHLETTLGAALPGFAPPLFAPPLL